MDIARISDHLSLEPKPLPGCCLSISSTLVSYLADALPKKPDSTISVGCGTGLLEALIAYRHHEVCIEGVEVTSTVNRFIPERDMNVVGGTWDLCARASEASAWMFVYPREPKLVSRYIALYGDESVETILWLGPQADWMDYEPCFRNSAFSNIKYPEDAGLAPYELLATMTKRHVS